MEKPEVRNSIPENFVDFLFQTYKPVKNAAGDYYKHTIDYITFELNFLESSHVKKCIQKYGFAPIGFLLLLRIYMCNESGFGICITDNTLKKILFAISIDTDVEMDQLHLYYDQLLECGLLIFIEDKEKTFVSTYQQVYNWEYKYWTRYVNRLKKSKAQKNENKNESADTPTANEESSETQEQDHSDSADQEYGFMISDYATDDTGDLLF